MVLRRKLPDGIVEQMQDRQMRVVSLPEATMRHIAQSRLRTERSCMPPSSAMDLG